MALNKLGVVKDIVESVGMEISHVYDDLVFLNHNAFILQFTEDVHIAMIHGNIEAGRNALQDAVTILKGAAEEHEMTFVDGDDYSISQKDDENLRIEFYPQ